MEKLKMWQKILISLVIGFGSVTAVAFLLMWLETQPIWVAISLVGGACCSALILFYLTREEHVYLCYHVGDDIHDVRIKAVCTTWIWREAFMEEGDCYRVVPLDKELTEATWEDLNYKTKDGYMTVE